MILSVLIFLPFFTSLLWVVIHRLMLGRTDTASHLFALVSFATITFFADTCFADRLMPVSMQVIGLLIAQGAAPCIVPLTIIYLRKLRGIETYHPLQMLWVIAPVALLTSALLLYFVAGHPAIESTLPAFYERGFAALESYRGSIVYLFYISVFIIFRFIIVGEFIWMFIYLLVYRRKGAFKFGSIPAFFSGKAPVRVIQLQAFYASLILVVSILKFPVSKEITVSSPWVMAIVGIIEAVLVFMFCYTALFGSKRSIAKSDVYDGWRYNYGRSNKDEVVGQMLDSLLDDAEDEAIRRLHEKFGDSFQSDEPHTVHQSPRAGVTTLSERIFSAVSDSWDEERRLSALQKLLLEEQVFLQPRLTLGDVAEKLDSNTSYVSRLVNNAYNLGFPEFINTLRIDYAEQYILNHREAKQDEIASKCGFLSASSFNNTFKKITGMTPKVWVASVDRDSKEHS